MFAVSPAQEIWLAYAKLISNFFLNFLLVCSLTVLCVSVKHLGSIGFGNCYTNFSVIITTQPEVTMVS